MVKTIWTKKEWCCFAIWNDNRVKTVFKDKNIRKIQDLTNEAYVNRTYKNRLIEARRSVFLNKDLRRIIYSYVHHIHATCALDAWHTVYYIDTATLQKSGLYEIIGSKTGRCKTHNNQPFKYHFRKLTNQTSLINKARLIIEPNNFE